MSADHATSFPRSEARALLALAQVERTRGNLADAQVHVEAAIRIIESLRAKFVGAEHRSSYLAVQQGSYELYIDLLMQLHERTPTAGHAAHALQVSERARARALLESLAEAQADIRQGVAPSLLERERALQAQLNAKEQQRLKLLSGKPTPEQTAAADRAVEAALTEYQQVQAQIRATSPRYAALTQPQPLEIRQMQAQLDEATLLLVYSLGVKRSFLWAVTPTTVKSYELPAREKLEKDARRVIDLLLHSHERKSSALAGVVAEEFSRQILGPVAGQLAQQRLVIVADGALHSIPFAALFTPGRKQRLIAEHEIVNLPSVSALSQLRQDSLGRGSAPKTIAVIADPVFKLEDVRFGTTVKRATAATQEFTGSLATLQRAARDIGLKDLYRLQASGREADQIIRLVPPSLRTLLVGFDASRATLAQTDLSQYQMLHFATHSFIHPQSSELSGIVLSLYDRKRHAQDGFLRAHEIYNLKLNADLVVLSACRTAGDKVVRGEGLIGLSRGFMYAGAPRLIVSLWEVNDVATAELMQRFYRGMLRDKLRPAAALRAAQSAMAQEPRWSAPYYWAGFVLQGEWR